MEMELSKVENHYLRNMGDKAHQGEEVVIMRDGQPWLRLIPCPDYTPPPPQPLQVPVATARRVAGQDDPGGKSLTGLTPRFRKL